MIDHQIVNRCLRPYYVANSAAVFRADAYITGYGNNTSDHYPVYARYDFRRTPAPSLSVRHMAREMVFDGTQWYCKGGSAPQYCRVFSASGKCVYEGSPKLSADLPYGCLIMEWRFAEGMLLRRLWVRP